MIDRYTKIVLTVIAVALVALVIRPFLEPRIVSAQNTIPVKIVGTDSHSLAYAGPLQVICVGGCTRRE